MFCSKNFFVVNLLFLSLLFLNITSAQAKEFTFDEVKPMSPDSTLAFPLFNALNKAGTNQSEMLKALKDCKSEEEKKAMVYLLAWMPERDLLTLKADFLQENVRVALKARNEFPWAKELKEHLFFNDVLPYAILNERRDNWRQDFYNKFSPLVKNCKTMKEAAEIINKNIKEIVKVKYSTKRKKADQSPYESMESGLASCSGLSILLSNAFRSVGIPSRVVGIPSWTNKRGNHNWNEVWFDGKWHLTEYYMDSKGFDHGWLLADAAKADASKVEHRIYASSYLPTKMFFPLVWDYTIRYVHGVDVTKFYKDLAAKRLNLAEMKKQVAIVLYKEKGGQRVAQNIRIRDLKKEVAKGKTRGPLADMNNMLQFSLEKGQQYFITYYNDKGRPQSHKFTVDQNDGIQKIELYQR